MISTSQLRESPQTVEEEPERAGQNPGLLQGDSGGCTEPLVV